VAASSTVTEHFSEDLKKRCTRLRQLTDAILGG
jgi:hypothetical protein